MRHLLKLVFLIFMVIQANAATITIADTTIPRGAIYSVPVICDFNGLSSKSFELSFAFDQFVLDISDIEIPDTSPLFNYKYTISHNLSTTPGILLVKFDSLDINLNSGIIFNLKIQGLVAPRDTSKLICTNITNNGKLLDFKTQEAIINVPGELIYQDYPLGLFDNFPNPFRGSTTFQFNLESETNVKFELFNYFGTRLYDYSELGKYITIISISKENGNKEITDFNSALPKGKYYLRFNADDYYFPSGAYILTMNSNNQFFSQPFLYVK